MTEKIEPGELNAGGDNRMDWLKKIAISLAVDGAKSEVVAMSEEAESTAVANATMAFRMVFEALAMATDSEEKAVALLKRMPLLATFAMTNAMIDIEGKRKRYNKKASALRAAAAGSSDTSTKH